MVYNLLDDEYEVMIKKRCVTLMDWDYDHEDYGDNFEDLPSAEKACSGDAECVGVQIGYSGYFHKCADGYDPPWSNSSFEYRRDADAYPDDDFFENPGSGIVFKKKGTLLLTL